MVGTEALKSLRRSKNPVHVDVVEIISEAKEKLTNEQLDTVLTLIEYGWNRGYKKGYDAAFVEGEARGEARGLERAAMDVAQWARDTITPRLAERSILALVTTPAAPVRSYEDGVHDTLDKIIDMLGEHLPGYLIEAVRTLKAVPRG